MGYRRLKMLLMALVDHVFASPLVWCGIMTLAIIGTYVLYQLSADRDVVIMPHSFLALTHEGDEAIANRQDLTQAHKLELKVDTVLAQVHAQLTDDPTLNKHHRKHHQDPFAGIDLPDEASYLQFSAIKIMPSGGPRYLTPEPETFTQADAAAPALQPETEAASGDLAIRHNGDKFSG